MRYTIALICAVFVLFGCTDNACKIPAEIEKIDADIKIERLEEDFFKIQSKSEAKAFMDEHPLFADKFLQRKRYPADSIPVNMLYSLATNPGIKQLVDETEEAFKDVDWLEKDLENAVKHVKYHYPDYVVPEVKTFITGLGQDMLVQDSLIVLGIDFFIGPKATYKPEAPLYIQRRYRKEFIVPSVVLLISNKYNETDFLNKSLLSEMVDFGKSYYFAEKMLPCAPDSLLMGYTAKEMADVVYNEGQIWAHFIENNLLYETNHFKVNKYIGERPNIPEIGTKCPGRVGAWVGWQIVRKYMAENPNVTLQELMAEKDAQKIFTSSRYKPKLKS